MLEVYLVAEVLACLLVRAQCVEGRGDDRAGQLLVVEDGDAGGGDDGEEDGEGARPFECLDICVAGAVSTLCIYERHNC